MKRTLLILAFIISSTTASFAQSDDCSVYKDGKFKIMEPGTTGTTIIERKGGYQIETNAEAKIVLRFKVQWVDNCTYTLQLDKYLQNDNNVAFPKDLIITVKITEVLKDGYMQESTSNLFKNVYTSKVIALK